ncbi:MAG: hypothetical protein HN919_04600, partial [Verrucomicrobia bacterium]|nr:hypothetical protein [Verrucomicrobiota bacterium]
AHFDISADHHGNSVFSGTFTLYSIAFDYSGEQPQLNNIAMSFDILGGTVTGPQHAIRGTLFYNYDGPLVQPMISQVSMTSADVTMQLDDLLPGSTITVETATSLMGQWNPSTSFVCETTSPLVTNAAPTSGVSAVFYRLKAEFPSP